MLEIENSNNKSIKNIKILIALLNQKKHRSRNKMIPDISWRDS